MLRSTCRSLKFAIIFTMSLVSTLSLSAYAETTAPTSAAPAAAVDSVRTLDGPNAADMEICRDLVERTSRPEALERLKTFCDRARLLVGCASHEGRPIFHVEHIAPDSNSQLRGKRILTLGLIHGDEPLSGEMTLSWAERLRGIPHRSSWRVVPMLNPDGLIRKTRMNARGVDLNRNFPTRDWNDQAINYWETSSKRDPRRNPGESPASEVETRCAIAHIKSFKPDIIISNHTPYAVIDFDGPKMNFPRYRDLPWRALGNFPGSLGRYMWKDHQVPVVTVELGHVLPDTEALQDLLGTFSIEAARRAGTKQPDLFDLL
jgi:protein MpaA